MLVVKPGAGGKGEEELRAISVLAGISHGQQALDGVSELEVLIRELGSVDAFSTCAIEPGEVSTLHHETLDDSMENGVLKAEDLA